LESFPISELAGVVICIILSAYFSGTETALTALSNAQTEKLAEKWKFIAPILKKWNSDPGLILSSILIGNNIVNILGALLSGKIAYHFLSGYQNGLADAVAVGVMTIMVLIFGEVTPKTFAKVNPQKWVVPALFFLRMFQWILIPFSIILSKFAKIAVKIVGGEIQTTGLTQTDIEHLIKLGNHQGVFEEVEQGELLTSVIEFKYTLVKEIMLPRTDTHFLDCDTTIQETLEKIEQWGHSRVPVYGESVDDIIGILYVKDLVELIGKPNVDLSKSINDLLRKPVSFVPETQKINETLKTMQAGGTHMAIVVDEFGGTAGIITLEDIIEELVGDIRDEDDKEEDYIVKIKDDEILVDAHISISDLEEELDISIPDDGEYNSLGGFIISEVGNVPPEGFILKFDNYEFTVVESNERHIVKIKIIIHPPEEEGDDQTDSY
jgi:putative hemolysin